ncbi:proline dipeptidase [Salmonella enterica subsp. arizonae]|uniref:Xaa-Pro dipeptidase n=12 Tax=Salmonella enterica TaxID=28901 RepID=A0A379TLH7_SALER|nr:proline dipeptidase [Salmonella enterica subsp. arizonae]
MESLAALYKNHIVTLQERTRDVLARFKLDALLIHSGELFNVFLDDHPYPFKVNPQFKAWVPVTQVPNCWLLVDGVNKPKLWFYLPVDYWHNVEPLPTSFWTEEIEVVALPKADGIGSQLPAARGNIGYIGPAPERALQLDIAANNINPKGVIDYLHYYRAYKTDYELACMREAQKMAVSGHHAAEEAFRSGMSEFDINLAYLTATGHRDTDVPYSNIVALNEHAAVLHYTKLDHQAPSEMRSFLLDAGAEYNGYAADLTRTWSAKNDNDYAQLVKDVNDEQLALIATMKAGISYVDYHIQFHQRIAKLLRKHQIITDMSEEAMVENDLTGPFMPHGIGHPLGLQVHDVAGFMQDDSGTHLAAPSKYPYLRCTRVLQPRMVLTIEPGIYFIESLLAPWREGPFSKHFNWQKIEALKPFGGIRIGRQRGDPRKRRGKHDAGFKTSVMDSWLIPAAPVTVVEEIKKSRFITLLAHTDGVDAAKAFVESVRAEHPDARHHCVAWVAGAPDDSQQLGFSDDGEPAGTAGKPMLAQLMGSGVGEITAVVVRYYGGILLGTGGLVKAYGGGVNQALRQLATQRKTPLTEYTLQCEYGQLAGIEALLGQFAGKIVSSDYQASVRLRGGASFCSCECIFHKTGGF